jgi:site-specific recombinase XerD
MRVSAAAQEYELANHRKSPNTQDWYRQKLDVFAEWCDNEGIAVEAILPTHVRRFVDVISTRVNKQKGTQVTSHTLHGYVQVIKAFLNFCQREEFTPLRVYERVRSNVEAPKPDAKVIEVFTEEQLRRLFAACQKEHFPELVYRDKAILSILLDTGIRANELCSLTLKAMTLTQDESYLKVLGKGRKEREVGIGNKARLAIQRYVHQYRRAAPDYPYVFISRRREEFTPGGLDQLLGKLERWSGISGVRCSAHTFRHTFAVNYLLHGGDIYALSRLLGHGDTKTTEIYLRAMKQSQVRRASFSLLDHIS